MFIQRSILPIILTLSFSITLLTGSYFLAHGYSSEKGPVIITHEYSFFGIDRDTVPTPKNLEPIIGNSVVDLRWDIANPVDVEGFLVYRWTNGEMPLIIARLPADITNWSDTSVSNGTTYFYMIISVGLNLLKSDVDAQVIVTPVEPAPVPPLPLQEQGSVITEYEEDSNYDYSYEEPQYNPVPVQQPEPAPPIPTAPPTPPEPTPEPLPDPPPDDGGCPPLPPDDGGGGG